MAIWLYYTVEENSKVEVDFEKEPENLEIVLEEIKRLRDSSSYYQMKIDTILNEE
jgi:hypothetical protein